MEGFKEYKYKGKTYKVYFIEKKEIAPAFGYAYWGNKEVEDYAVVRKDLPTVIQNFVIKHELYHLGDTQKWWGVFGSELRANLVPGITNPIGLLACILFSLLSKERILFYIDRIKKKY